MEKFEKEIKIFKQEGGVLRTRQAIGKGINQRKLACMRMQGVIEQISKGLYRISAIPPLENPDISIVVMKIPQGVICLISALVYHNITTQIPQEVHITLKSGSEKPRLKYPPTQFYWISEPAFSSGIEIKKIDGVLCKIYSPEKTVADCFKFRNKIGLDIAIEALKLCRKNKHSSVDTLMKFAKICRVAKIMKPYIEAIL